MGPDAIEQAAQVAADAILAGIDEIAREKGIPWQEAFDLSLRHAVEKIRRKEKFGSMPDDYDPELDPDHPSKGWTP